MPHEFPSEAWIKEYQRRLNDNEEYETKASGWGVGFNGDFVFHIEADESLPEDQYYFVGLEDGEVYDCRRIDTPEDVEYGFIFRGAYEDWKQLNKGEIGAIDGMLSGVFDIEGDMQKILQYSDAAVAMTETSNTIETEYRY